MRWLSSDIAGGCTWIPGARVNIFGLEITGDHARLLVAVFGGVFASFGFLAGRWTRHRSAVAFKKEDLVGSTLASELYGFEPKADGRVTLHIVTQGSAEAMASVFTNADLVHHIQRAAHRHPGLLLLPEPVAHRMMMDEGKDRITGLDPKANLDFVQGRPVREDCVLFGFAAYPERENGNGHGDTSLHDEVARLVQMVVAERYIASLADPAFIARVDVAHAGYKPRVARLHDFAREWVRLESLQRGERSAAIDKIWKITVRTSLT
jgi:hypothetical protein